MTIKSVRNVRRVFTIAVTSLAVALPVWSVTPSANADPAPSATAASDTFDRSTSGGWGSSNVGGNWTSTDSAKVSVSTGQGRVSLGSGQGVVQALPASLTDMRATVSAQVDSLPTTGNGMSAGVGVRTSSSGAYVATLRFGRSGAVSLNLIRQRTGTSDVLLVSDALLPLRATAGGLYTAQVDVIGTSPVQLRARAWPASGVAPDWQVSFNDNDGSRVTAAGGLSLRTYLSGSSTPLRVGYDDVLLQRLVDGTTPAVPPVSATGAGSLPIGTAEYSVPSSAIYVTASGARTGSGTASSPYGSLAYGIERAASGATIVMRGGVYRESTVVPFGKQLTIQSYPREAVWLDGSSAVSGWQRSGNAWVVSNWNSIFDHRVSHSRGVDESSRFIDPAYPLAGYPDQVWISGSSLRQVGSIAALVPGTFFVDEPGRRLFVGSDPTGKSVEASTRQQAMVIVGTGTVIRGIGARRYANTFWMGGAFSAQVNNITLENVVAADNATVGVNGWGKQMRFNRITLSGNGALGLGLNTADDFQLSRSLVQANNKERFKEAPVSGGAKITLSRRVMITDNVFERNLTTGLWFDVSAYDITVTGNRFSDNVGTGVELEALSKAVVANNYFLRNGKAGLYIIDANSIAVWNNTFYANAAYSLRLFQDERRNSDPVFSLLVRDISIRNNVLSYGTGSCPYLVHDVENKVTGQAMRVTSQGSAFHRISSTSPANLVCWANAAAGLASYKTLSTFRAATGNDTQSTLSEGVSILTSAYQLTPAALSSTAAVALPISEPFATLMGVPVNTRKLGAVTAAQ